MNATVVEFVEKLGLSCPLGVSIGLSRMVSPKTLANELKIDVFKAVKSISCMCSEKQEGIKEI